jgi:hypothetical protein
MIFRSVPGPGNESSRGASCIVHTPTRTGVGFRRKLPIADISATEASRSYGSVSSVAPNSKYLIFGLGQLRAPSRRA